MVGEEGTLPLNRERPKPNSPQTKLFAYLCEGEKKTQKKKKVESGNLRCKIRDINAETRKKKNPETDQSQKKRLPGQELKADQRGRQGFEGGQYSSITPREKALHHHHTTQAEESREGEKGKATRKNWPSCFHPPTSPCLP